MQHVIRQTEETATSHHIQRLMVTGNFALLAGLDPKAVCEWYLAVYADAYEWVELPNTLGMALFGDGGIVGSKPYAASGAYIHRMSDFCKGCPYNVKERSGDTACPFNRLYWDFLPRNAERLRTNPRMGFAYKNLDRMDSTELKAIRASADAFLSEI
jgi:deoxyribodipyrimidine photolyase-related protein